MTAELLVALLWGGVLVYWLWRRRPSFADSIGSFRYELSVLGHAAPSRVAPAHRLSPMPLSPASSMSPGSAMSGPTPARAPHRGPTGLRAPLRPAHLAASPPGRAGLPPSRPVAAKSYQRLELRRRRRDVLSVLGGAVALSLLFALVTASAALLYLQACTDVAFVAYVALLVRASNPKLARPGYRPARPRAGRPQGWGGHPGYGRHGHGSYGDFGSYAELASARAS